MISIQPRKLALGSLLTTLLITGFSSSAQAELTMMPWQTVGILEVVAKAKGKSVKRVDKAIGPWTSTFTMNGGFELKGEGLVLTGNWQPGKKKGRFTGTLDGSSINALKTAMEQDLLAQSNLSVALNVNKVSFSGLEKPEGVLKGTLVIKGELIFADLGGRRGALAMNYRLTGTPQ